MPEDEHEAARPSQPSGGATDGRNQSSGITETISRLANEAKQSISIGRKVPRNITHEFTQASNLLEPGELVKDEFFTLFEAVGALEIMDAKMDSGYVPPDDIFDPDFDVSRPLSPAEALWIMDQLMCLEITWQDGYPLSQTIFTSLHVHHLLSPNKKMPYDFYDDETHNLTLTDEQSWVHLALSAFCQALVHGCQLSLDSIQSQNFYEEEDFVTHLFGRELLPKVGRFEIEHELEWAMVEGEKKGLQGEVFDAILSHIKFRQKLLRLLDHVDGEMKDSASHLSWNHVLPDLERIKNNHKLAVPCPNAFSEKVQRQLATSTPPRPMLQISWDLACSKWKTLVEDMIAAHHFTRAETRQSPAGLHRAVWAFSSRDQPYCLARAEIQSILFSHAIGMACKEPIPHFELLLNDIRDLVLPADPLTDPTSFEIELPSDPRHICSRHIEAFMDKAIEEFLNLYRMVCQNRCRIRRTFTQAVPILDEMETVAAMTDLELQKLAPSLTRKINRKTEKLAPLASWVKFHKLRIMAWTVQLGFETEIYLPDELGEMYFFLSRLSGQRLRVLDLMMAFVGDRMRKAPDTWTKEECAASMDYLTSLHNTAMITLTLAEALATLYKALTKVNIIVAPKRDFAQTNLLYEARMKPFLNVTNDAIPTVHEFEKWRRSTDSVGKMCEEVGHWVQRAKHLVAETKKMTPEQAKYVGTEEEWTKEWKRVETTCVAVSVTSSQLGRASEKFGEDELEEKMQGRVEKKYHEWWVVPFLKERPT